MKGRNIWKKLNHSHKTLSKMFKEKAKEEGTEKRELGACPKCQKGDIIATPKAYGCSTWRESGCDFVIWKAISGYELKPKHVKQLLKKSESSELIKGFKTKDGKPFDAKLKLENHKKYHLFLIMLKRSMSIM